MSATLAESIAWDTASQERKRELAAPRLDAPRPPTTTDAKDQQTVAFPVEPKPRAA